MRKIHAAGAAVSAVALMVMSSPVRAQEAPADVDTVAPNDINDTAQKREQALVDVPISIAALNAETLEKNRISALRDFVGQVPNLFVNNFPGRSDTVRIFIRGVGQNDVILTQDPSVALYVDGVYVGTTVGGGFETEDLERIEVLRGPQGTLYGRNATGGAINLISTKPQLDAFAAKGSLTYGNYDARRAGLTLNVPLGDKAAVRVSGLRAKRDGLQQNTGPGRDFAEQNHTALRAAVRLAPTDALTIDYAFDYSRNKDTGTLTVPTQGATTSYPVTAPFPIPGTFGLATGITRLVNEFSVASPFGNNRLDRARAYRELRPNDGKVNGHNLTIEWEASDALTLRSITGHRRIHNDQYSDNLPVHQASIVTSVLTSSLPMLPPGTVLNVIGPNGAASGDEAVRFESTSQEVQLLGKAGLGQGSLEYVLGGYYYEDEGSAGSAGSPVGAGTLLLDANTQSENRSYAAFGELTLRPGSDEKLSITLGARYSHDRRTASRINEFSFSFAALGGFTAANCAYFALTFQALGQTCTPGGSVQGATYAKKFDNFSPSVTVAYKASDDLNLYAKFVRGYKTGGTSQRSANPTNFAIGFAPEKVSSFEAGIKGNSSDRRFSYALAAFYMRTNNLQASVQTGATGGDRDFIAIDGNDTYGIEFDLSAALLRHVRMGLSGALMRAKLGARSASILRDTGQTSVEEFVPDQTSAPRASGNVYLDINQPLANDWEVSFHGNASYQSRSHTSTNASDDRVIAGKVLVDANIGLARQIDDEKEIRLTLWAKNIFDKEYQSVNFGSFAFSGATTVTEFGEPRTYGLSLSFRY